MESVILNRGRSVAIGHVDQIPPGEGRNFEVAGLTVAVFRARTGEVYATQAQCPHKNGPLADGILGGGMIMCPLHDRLFDLATGHEVGGDCSLTIYPVTTTVDGKLMLTVPD